MVTLHSISPSKQIDNRILVCTGDRIHTQVKPLNQNLKYEQAAQTCNGSKSTYKPRKK